MGKKKIFKELNPLFEAILDSVIAEIPREDDMNELVDLRGVKNV